MFLKKVVFEAMAMEVAAMCGCDILDVTLARSERTGLTTKDRCRIFPIGGMADFDWEMTDYSIDGRDLSRALKGYLTKE